MARTLLPRSLTGRLVVTAVALVALAAVLIGAATTLAMQRYLTDRLDAQLVGIAERGGAAVPRPPDGPGPAYDGPGPGRGPGGDDGPEGLERGPRSLGTLLVDLSDGSGGIVSADDTLTALDAEDRARLAEVPVDGGARTVRLEGLGDYRVIAASDPTGDTVVVGLPTEDLEAAIGRLLATTLLLALGAVALAAVGGTLLVRRQLRPLREVSDTAHEVATLPLSAGGASIPTRVRADLTTAGTEVGQVGLALNTLLDHVDDALAARHRSEQQVRRFVADASHELRTPLATIHGYAELSRRTPDDAAALTHAMGRVGTEATRMSRLVEDLLLLARLDQGRPLERTEVDLTRMLLELVADARVVAPDHRWRLDLPEADPVTVIGDEHRLHQVMSNLVGNARRHTPAGTTVTVGARRVDGGALLTVHDDGPGVPAADQERIFERFARGDASRTRTDGGPEGAGLGLSLVRAIVASHGGAVTLSSTPGDTAFRVSLPA